MSVPLCAPAFDCRKAGSHGRPQTSHLCLFAAVDVAVDAKGGDEVFVELEPDLMAGVNVSLVDPVMVTRLRFTQRGFETLGVTVESGKHIK